MQQNWQLLSTLRSLILGNNNEQVQKILEQLKFVQANFDSLDPTKKVTIPEEIDFSRQLNELNVAFALQIQNLKEYESAMLRLRVFYEDFPDQNQSAEYSTWMAVYLLYLISFNRFTDFHTVLELIPFESLQTPSIQLVLSINTALSEGNYKKVLQFNQQNNIAAHFQLFLKRIDDTVRFEIARSAEKAYQSLHQQEAFQIFNFNNQQDLNKFIEQQKQFAQDVKWEVRDNRLYFIKNEIQQNQVNHEKTLFTMMNYTMELDKVI